MSYRPRTAWLSVPSILRFVGLGLSFLLFLVSLPLNCAFVERASDHHFAPGYALLAFGALGIFDGIIAWYANPLWLIAAILCLFRVTRHVAFVIATIAVAVGLTFLTVTSVMENEGGARTRITGYDLGFYLWIASLVVMVFATGIGMFVGRVIPVAIRIRENDRESHRDFDSTLAAESDSRTHSA